MVFPWSEGSLHTDGWELSGSDFTAVLQLWIPCITEGLTGRCRILYVLYILYG